MASGWSEIEVGKIAQGAVVGKSFRMVEKKTAEKAICPITQRPCPTRAVHKKGRR
jgi:hypothetical protein